MTMIRPKIKGLPMTSKKLKGESGGDKSPAIGKKAKGNLKGEFLGTSKMVS